MARFCELGPLILVLCMALCGIFGNSKQTEPSPDPTSSSSGESRGGNHNNSDTPSPSKEAITSEKPALNQTQTDKSTSPPLTSQQHSTGSTADPLPSRTPPQISQSTETGTANNPIILASTPPPSSSPAVSPALSSTTGPEPKCRFRLSKTDSQTVPGVNIINGTNKTYMVEIMVTSHSDTKIVQPVKKNQETFRIKTTWLKPCTNYTVKVKDCESTGDITFISSSSYKGGTLRISKNSTQVCYQDKNKWNYTACVNVSNLEECTNSPAFIQLDTCNYTLEVFNPPAKPIITFEKTIPSKFIWNNKPAQCNDPFNVTCTRDTWSRTFELNQSVSLLPSKTYNCVGQYTYKELIKSHFSIYIKCDWQKNTISKFSNIQNNSFIMIWHPSQEKTCPGIELHSYSASCNNGARKNCNAKKNSIQCSFNELEPYTIYTCEIKATVNTSDTSDPSGVQEYFISTGTQQTHAGKPSFTESQANIRVDYPSHNALKVTCNDIKKEKDWNGGQGTYKAKLRNNGHEILLENSTCFFLFEDLYYLTTYEIEITAENKERKSSAITDKATTKYNDKAVVGFLIFLIIVTTIGLLFVLYKVLLLKRKRNDEDEKFPPSPEPILAENLVDTYNRKMADDSRLFMDEFQSIPRIFSNYSIKEAKKTENQSKNRYVDILPYDYNRVTLSTSGNNDYINASFIEGYKEPEKYIAAQGPKDETVEDFWRMIWEQKSAIIVMVTRCEEGNKSKCAQYWPCLDSETEIYGDFVVKIRSEERCPDYITRHLLLTNKTEKAAEREVSHIQFISWPDHGVPGDPSLLLKLRRRVNSFKNFFSGPVVVHCSAGVGRTGTYICIDAMIESLEAEGKADIYSYVAKLRRQRCLMVQVEAQYILIHMALIEYNQFGETEISLSDFHSVLKTLQLKDGNDPSLLEKEFQKLPKYKNWRTFNTASSDENTKKNRYSSIVPYDYNRVLFRLDLDRSHTSDPEDEEEYSSEEEEESSEYINASFIDGYWCHKSLIAAQGPLPNTTAEFLLMLYQQQAKTLVMLTDCKEDDEEFCDQYWGDEKKIFGEMEIKVKKTESFTTYVRRRLEIQSTKKQEVLEVDQYQFLKWRSSDLPENAQELTEMMRNIRESGGYDNSPMNRNVPVVVHCNNGSSRSGIFCALWILMDSASTEKLVDVFQVVKNLRRERQGMIQSYEQYQFLYSALEGAFPVQNGAIKSPASDSVRIINETTALLPDLASNTSPDQKETETSNTVETSV